MDCFASLAMTVSVASLLAMTVFDPTLLAMTISSLLHQCIARGGELLEFPRVAAGVRMHALGDALVGLVDFGSGQAAAERQAEHLPVTLRGRERLRIGLALAELRRVQRAQDVADNAEAAPPGVSGDRVG